MDESLIFKKILSIFYNFVASNPRVFMHGDFEHFLLKSCFLIVHFFLPFIVDFSISVQYNNFDNTTKD